MCFKFYIHISKLSSSNILFEAEVISRNITLGILGVPLMS